MKVLIVAGAYPPVKCGVGDYTFHLAEMLAAKPGIEVGVLTSSEGNVSNDMSNVKVFRVMPNWGIRQVIKLVKITKYFSPDIIHIQYPTQSFFGCLPKYLPLLFRLMRFPVVQTWHEHYSECVMIGWQNVLFGKNIIYVRPDLPDKLPKWVNARLNGTYIPNASTIPISTLNEDEKKNLKSKLSHDKHLICYFGFAYPNKGVEQLFEIIDPKKHHLALICELDKQDLYQANLLKLARNDQWTGAVTITGFLPAIEVANILAVSDAIIFPFREGAGEWNTSLKAAQSSGTFTIATTETLTKCGYHEDINVYYVPCNDVNEIRRALSQHLGKRVNGKITHSWEDITSKHELIYNRLIRN